jgi:hypothetical protein
MSRELRCEKDTKNNNKKISLKICSKPEVNLDEVMTTTKHCSLR